MKKFERIGILIAAGLMFSILAGWTRPSAPGRFLDLPYGEDGPQTTVSSQTHELMDGISQAFEQAADKVSAFVVPIFAKGRSSVGLAAYEDFIQTDAPINPGNSGGALADLDGNIVGINTAISSPSGGNVNLGFAIPINMAKSVMNELLSKGRVIRGYLGLTAQDIDDSLVKPLKLKDTNGALINEITPGSPAEKAGLKAGDVITSFDGKKVENSSAIHTMAAQTAPGTSVTIGLFRDGQEKQVTATLIERPSKKSETAIQEEEPRRPTTQRLGLTIQTLTPDIARQLGYDDDTGAVIADVAPGSPADDAGLQRGDLIKEVNRMPIRTAQDFEKAVRGLNSGESMALLIRRAQGTFFVPLKIQ